MADLDRALRLVEAAADLHDAAELIQRRPWPRRSPAMFDALEHEREIWAASGRACTAAGVALGHLPHLIPRPLLAGANCSACRVRFRWQESMIGDRRPAEECPRRKVGLLPSTTKASASVEKSIVFRGQRAGLRESTRSCREAPAWCAEVVHQRGGAGRAGGYDVGRVLAQQGLDVVDGVLRGHLVGAAVARRRAAGSAPAGRRTSMPALLRMRTSASPISG